MDYATELHANHQQEQAAVAERVEEALRAGDVAITLSPAARAAFVAYAVARQHETIIAARPVRYEDDVRGWVYYSAECEGIREEQDDAAKRLAAIIYHEIFPESE